MPIGAIPFVTNNLGTANNNSATLAMTNGTCLENDLLIAYIMSNDNLTWTAPAEWTRLGLQTNNTTAMTATIFWKAARAADSGAVFNFVKSANNSLLSFGVIDVWRNARMDAPVDANGAIFLANAVAADNINFSSLTPKGDSSKILWVGFYNLSATTYASTMVGTTTTSQVYATNTDVETATGNTASIGVCASRHQSKSATGAGTLATTSTVDAISIGAVIALSEGISEYGGGGINYGVSGGPGGRGARGDGRPKLKNEDGVV